MCVALGTVLCAEECTLQVLDSRVNTVATDIQNTSKSDLVMLNYIWNSGAEKLLLTELVNEIFYVTQMFITVFKTARHLTLS